ncbi:MAG: hypothetical protein AB4290_28925 [Spirulina sp.]
MTPNTPHALQIWDNQARLSLPLPLKIWLTVLVLTFLSSLAFVHNHYPPRWVIGGFILSHLFVFLWPVVTTVKLQRGIVSLAHVVCWSPGYLLTIVEVWQSSASGNYHIWLLVTIVVISIAFIFDLRDSASYIYFWLKGKIPA